MVTKTWFKSEFKTKVNLSIGLKPNLAFRLSFGLKPKLTTKFQRKLKVTQCQYSITGVNDPLSTSSSDFSAHLLYSKTVVMNHTHSTANQVTMATAV